MNKTTREILRAMGVATAAHDAGDYQAEDQAWARCFELDDGSDTAGNGNAGLPPFRLRPYLLRADSLRERGDLIGALAILDRAAVRWPDSAIVHTEIGRCHFCRKDWAATAAAFQRSFELRPDAGSCVFLALSLIELRRRDEAAAWLHRGLAIDPAYEEAHYNLGRMLEDDGDRDGAIERFARAIDLDPDYAIAHDHIGPLLMRRALESTLVDGVDWQRALHHLCRASDLRPEDGWPHTRLALMYEQEKRFHEAEYHYRQAARLLPGVGLMWSYLGEFLARRGESEEAERLLRHAVSIDPEDGWVRFWLGKHLWYMRCDDEARIELGRAQDLGYTRARDWLAAREAEDNEDDEADDDANA